MKFFFSNIIYKIICCLCSKFVLIHVRDIVRLANTHTTKAAIRRVAVAGRSVDNRRNLLDCVQRLHRRSHR